MLNRIPQSHTQSAPAEDNLVDVDSMSLTDLADHIEQAAHAYRKAELLGQLADDRPIAINQWLHLMGTFDSSGKLSLAINGWPLADAQGKLIADTPEQTLHIGTDCVNRADADGRLPNWTGLLEDLRL